MPTPTPPFRTPLERTVVVLDVVLGLALCAAAVYLYVVSTAGRMEATDPFGGAFGLLMATVLGPPGVLFVLAAVGVARRWRGRWWLHLLPLLAPALLAALAASGLLG